MADGCFKRAACVLSWHYFYYMRIHASVLRHESAKGGVSPKNKSKTVQATAHIHRKTNDFLVVGVCESCLLIAFSLLARL